VSPIVVLLVEDFAVIRALVRRMLVAGGHAVVEAAGGAAALTVCREEQPDVVLLDVEMPEMTTSASRASRPSSWPGSRRPPG
jgi:CheY-like chemotaxis protein